MPVEIKELVVRAEVVNANSDKRKSTCDPDSPAAAVRERETLVAACVEQVLAVLEKRRER